MLKNTFLSSIQLHLISKVEQCILGNSVSFCFEYSGGNDYFTQTCLIILTIYDKV